MDNPEVEYCYAQGALLEQPNNYFYTEFQGQAFLIAWQQNRRVAIRSKVESNRPSQEIKIKPVKLLEIDTQNLLLALIKGVQQDRDYWLLRLVKKFEVTKRLFSSYQKKSPHAPTIGASFYDMDLYLLFAELLIKLEQEERLKFQKINVLLKVMDTLISQRQDLTSRQHGHLNWLIEMEQKIINLLIQDVRK